jgi:hypothetical protein
VNGKFQKWLIGWENMAAYSNAFGGIWCDFPETTGIFRQLIHMNKYR